MSEARFEYNPQLKVMLLCGLFFAACAAVLAYTAYTNDKALLLNGIFEFSVSGASQFYWILTAVSCIFVLLGTLGVIHRLVNGRQYLLISENALTMPKGIFTQEQKVRFSSIKGLQSQNVSGTITHTFKTDEANKNFSITNRNFKNRQEFEEAIQSILSKTNF